MPIKEDAIEPLVQKLKHSQRMNIPNIEVRKLPLGYSIGFSSLAYYLETFDFTGTVFELDLIIEENFVRYRTRFKPIFIFLLSALYSLLVYFAATGVFSSVVIIIMIGVSVLSNLIFSIMFSRRILQLLLE